MQLYKTEPIEYERRSRLHMICISSNNDRHPVTKTFTPLHYTCRNFTSSHYTSPNYSSLPFQLV